MKTRRILQLTFLLSMICFRLIGQNFEFNAKSFWGVWNNAEAGYFYDGAAIEFLYEHPLKKGALRTGLEYRSIDWGNQTSLNVSYVLPHVTKVKMDVQGVATTGLGLALFRENPLFVWSIGYTPEIVLRKNKRVNLSFGLGVRYTNSPAYKDFGSINQVLDFPLKIGLKFNGKNSSKKKS